MKTKLSREKTFLLRQICNWYLSGKKTKQAHPAPRRDYKDLGEKSMENCPSNRYQFLQFTDAVGSQGKETNMDGGNKDKWETIAVSSCRNVLQRECLLLHFIAATSLLPTTFWTNLILRSFNLVPSRESYFWEIKFQLNRADRVK